MTNASKIRDIIDKMPEGELFSANKFRHVASADNIKQVLSRLVRQKIIIRTARGVYLKPKIIENVGIITPSAREMAKIIAESTGEQIVIHGAEAARQLNLTTQVPMRIIFYTNGNSRTINFGNQTVELKHANPSRLIAPGTLCGTILSALLYLGKENVNSEIIEHIKKQVPAKDFNQIFSEIENIPAWLANAFYHYKKDTKNDK